MSTSQCIHCTVARCMGLCGTRFLYHSRRMSWPGFLAGCPSNTGTVPQVLLQMRSPLSFADCWEGWGSYAPASLVLWGFGLLWLLLAETTDSPCKWEEFTAHGVGVRLMEDREEEEARINSFLFQSPIHMRCNSVMDSQKTSWEIKAPTILAAIETSSVVVPRKSSSSFSISVPFSTQSCCWRTLLNQVVAHMVLSQALLSREPSKSLPGLAT